MSTTQISSAGGFFMRQGPKLQLSDQANPGSSPILSAVAIFCPDPNSAVGASQFVTATGPNWTVQILEAVAGTLGGAVVSKTVLATNNIIWIALDPAIFTPGNVYRVRLLDNAANVMDEWDFEVFSQSLAAGPSDIADINNSIRRIAGLLGYRQTVNYADYLYGVPRTTTIALRDGANATIATYRRKLTLNSAHEVIGETCVALDSNIL